VREAQKRGAKLVVIDPRTTALARAADVHLPVKPGTDVVVALAIHRYLFANGVADAAFLRDHTRGADRLRERADEWTIERAAETAGIDSSALERVAKLYAESTPALIRCGWGLERNRNGGNAAMAELALPAVGGKFGVRGGGYSMSNSASWNITRPWVDSDEPDTRVVNMNHLGRADRVCRSTRQASAVQVQLQPGGHGARSTADHPRSRARDLFTVVFEQVMTGHSAGTLTSSCRRPRSSRLRLARRWTHQHGNGAARGRRHRRSAIQC
jgi:anaerobic selenocysteine-containing dehydrogenase